MSLAGRSLVTIEDLSNGEIEALFSLTDEMAESREKQAGVCQNKIMASLFFEPSTRTRLSFEAAMHRLGGNVISAINIGATSLAKGESLADMAKVVGSYADIIVIRHPWEGAAKVVADYAGVPVINAGDGGHQHPTQTLLDLYTIYEAKGSIRGQRIALWGDLKYGRTVHSLIFALAKFGANILLCPSPGLQVPEYVLKKLTAEYGGEIESGKAIEDKGKGSPLPLDAIYMTPSRPHQLAMMPDISLEVELEKEVDALYVTRPQKERFAPGEDRAMEKKFPVVDKKLLEGKAFKRTLVMHPLPRVDELAYEVDADPRSMYFKQAAWGVPVRMALIALLLGAKKTDTKDNGSPKAKPDYPPYTHNLTLACSNSACVSIQETEIKYLKPEFKIIDRKPLTLRCVYCEHEVQPPYIASSQWHQGMLENRKYHSADSHWARTIKPENLIVFPSASKAEDSGFKPSQYATSPARKTVEERGGEEGV